VEKESLRPQVAENEQTIRTLSSDLQQSAQAIQTLSSQVAEKEEMIQRLASEADQKGRAVRELQVSSDQKDRAVRHLEATLNQIQSSHGWRALQHYYRLLGKLIPEGSRRRSVAKFFWTLPQRKSAGPSPHQGAQEHFTDVRQRPVDKRHNLRLRDIWRLTITSQLPRYVREGTQLLRDMRLIAASGLFDSDWYLQQNPDVAKAAVNPLRHYLRRGALEGRDPNRYFDSDWYLLENPDVARAGVNPLVHYLRRGAFQGRDPNGYFDSDRYLAENPEVAKTGVNPLLHYLRSSQVSITENLDCDYLKNEGKNTPHIQRPLVSIIIPCHNQGHFLVESVNSAIAAYAGELEIIIVDDGSDSPISIRALRDIRSLFPQIQIIRQDNKGLSEARNTGVLSSSGSFIQFLDADDVLVPGKIDAQIDHLSHAQEKISICNYLVADEPLHNVRKSEETIKQHPLDIRTFLYCWERRLSIPIHCGLFDRVVFNQVKFNPTLTAKEDWVFWCDLAKNGYTPLYLEIHGAIYRVHGGNMTRKSVRRMSRNWIKATIILDEVWGERYPDFLDSSFKWLREYYMQDGFYKDEMSRLIEKGHVKQSPVPE
jgi:glycosyltransferase involved in cell wall biosynthesis